MHLRTVLTSLLALALPAAHAQNLTLHSLTYAGNGCPSGSISHYFSKDGTYYNEIQRFTPYLGPGTSASDHRMVCKILANISTSEPQQRIAWDLLPDSMSLKGWASLSTNETMFVKMDLEWAGGDGKASGNLTIDGPSIGIFRKVPQGPENERTTLSPCGGGQLKIILEARAVHSGPYYGGIEPNDPSDEDLKWTVHNRLRVAPCA